MIDSPNELICRGSIPGDEETKEKFFHRISVSRKVVHNLPVELDFPLPTTKAIPKHHWDWAGKEIEQVYGIYPQDILAFYDNRKLNLWQGGATWIIDSPKCRFSFIRLKKILKKRKLLSLYSKEEILAHEAIHAIRCGFSDSPYEELFAYLVSGSFFRRIFGPILQKPRDAYIFLLPFAFLPLTPLLPPIYFSLFLSSTLLLVTLALFRLLFLRIRFFKCMRTLQKWTKSQKQALQLMLAMSGKEITLLSKCRSEEIPKKLKSMVGSFRWAFSFQRYFEKEK